MKDITFDMTLGLSKRARYKNVLSDYCHFVFQGYRIEAIKDDDNYIVCFCKGESPKKTNDIHNFNDQMIFIKDSFTEIIYNNESFSRICMELQKYIDKHR